LIIGLKIVFIVPLIGYTYYRTKKYTFAENFYLIWFCITIVACYPIVYNKITNDFGVSWVCLVIMYIYSCTPIRFFPCSVFCLFYLIIYVLMMLAVPAENNNSMSTSTSTTTPTTMTTTTTSSSSSSSSSTSSSSTSSNLSSDSLYVCLFYFLILLPSQSREFAIRVSYMSELMVLLQQEQLKMEETRSKLLLNSMLPESVVYQLQCGRELIADEYAHATVLFCEVCDFDFYSTKLKPQQVVELLNILFSKFDKLVDFHGVHKVETIGAVSISLYSIIEC
jgi:hypothetical protein